MAFLVRIFKNIMCHQSHSHYGIDRLCSLFY